MKQIKRTIVASGVIGQYSHEWTVIRLYDTKYDSESYEVFVAERHIASVSSVVEALSVIVEEFSE